MYDTQIVYMYDTQVYRITSIYQLNTFAPSYALPAPMDTSALQELANPSALLVPMLLAMNVGVVPNLVSLVLAPPRTALAANRGCSHSTATVSPTVQWALTSSTTAACLAMATV